VVLGLAIYTNVTLSRETVYVRTYTPDYLESLSGELEFYTIKEDIHSDFMFLWLGEFGVRKLNHSELEGVVSSARGEKGIGLLIGPSGTGSGMTVLKQACLADFNLNLEVEPRKVLPYYAYYPPFMMEEENSLALLFEGKAPDQREPSKNIRLIVY
jgi:hypothetical protein